MMHIPLVTVLLQCGVCNAPVVLHVAKSDDTADPERWSWHCPHCHAENVTRLRARLVKVSAEPTHA